MYLFMYMYVCMYITNDAFSKKYEQYNTNGQTKKFIIVISYTKKLSLRLQERASIVKNKNPKIVTKLPRRKHSKEMLNQVIDHTSYKDSQILQKKKKTPERDMMANFSYTK